MRSVLERMGACAVINKAIEHGSRSRRIFAKTIWTGHCFWQIPLVSLFLLLVEVLFW